jgi:type 1 glutamine amidotransferase
MRRLARTIAPVLLLGVACSTGPDGSTTGAAGTGATGAAGTGQTGTAGATGSGAAGTTSTGAAGTTSNTGAAGTSAAAGSGAAGTGQAGTNGQAGSSATDGGPPGTDGGAVDAVAAKGNKVLLYTKSTGFVHGSTKLAAAQLALAARAVGLDPEVSDDPTKFDAATLAQYAGVALIATAGEPFGSPGTAQVQALLGWVRAGGGLVAIENANNAYVNNADYIGLIGGRFNGHGAGVDTCTKDGVHPTTTHLPATFQVNDEWYNFTQLRMDNLVVLRCTSANKPISWVRNEGSGRLFYTALGHYDEEWMNGVLVQGHVLPGLLWSMGRPVP